MTNVTIFRNRANNPDFGAAIDNVYATTGWVTLRNSIVASNGRVNCRSVYVGQPPGPGLAGFIVSLGGNLDGDADYSPCGFVLANDLSRTDPRLAPPVEIGGIPQPLALLADSPAIDAGDDAACPATDGRGAPRPADGNGDSVARCDIGAYEVQP